MTKKKKAITKKKATTKKKESQAKKKSSKQKKKQVEIVTANLEQQVEEISLEEQERLKTELNQSIEDSRAAKKLARQKAKLSEKQKAFVDNYLIDLNASKAARKVGYSEKSTNVRGSILLAKDNIKSYVNEKMEERAKRTEITQDNVVKELAKIAFSDMKDFAVWNKNGVDLIDSDLLGDESSAIQEISSQSTEFGNNLKLKFYSKLTALELLGRHLKLELAKTQNNVNINGNIAVSLENLSDNELLAIMDDDEDGYGEEITEEES